MSVKLNIIPLFCKGTLRNTFFKNSIKIRKSEKFIKMLKFKRSHKSGKWPFPSKICAIFIKYTWKTARNGPNLTKCAM